MFHQPHLSHPSAASAQQMRGSSGTRGMSLRCVRRRSLSGRGGW
jgi:hypothetical protein